MTAAEIPGLVRIFYALGSGLVLLQGVTAAISIFTRFNPEKLRLALGLAGLASVFVGAVIQISVWVQ